MKMITKKLEKQIPTFDVDFDVMMITDETKVYAHYFVGNFDIWVFNYNKEEQMFYGYVYLGNNCKQLMTFSIKELEKPLNIPMNINGNLLKVPMKWEREYNFKTQTLQEVIDNENSGLNKFDGISMFI